MKTAVILAAGKGSRIWPYASCRPKSMITVAGRPIIEHQVSMLLDAGFGRILIVGAAFCEQYRHHFRNQAEVDVIDATGTKGNADSLSRVSGQVGSDFLVLYGDVLCAQEDLDRLAGRLGLSEHAVEVLVAPLNMERSNDHICCRIDQGSIVQISGHPRGDFNLRFAAFAMKKSFLAILANNPGLFPRLDVGIMPEQEQFLEISLIGYMTDGNSVPALVTEHPSIDIDKPWHILLANHQLVQKKCGQLTANVLAEDAVIDDSAMIDGYVQLGRGSRIGRQAIIKGNLIVGEETVIENGAIIDGNAIIGDHSYIGNYCHISGGTAIGNHCVVNHCAEVAGMIMDGVYLYHYMEISGLIGCNSDIGAATVCGSLRFDDGDTTHMVKGRREQPVYFANATFLGDYCRTGVNAIIMPGCKTGIFSIIGPGVLLNQDLPDRTMIEVEQKQVTRTWGPEKYGW